MSNPHPIAISIHQLGKQYRLGCERASYRTLRETLTDAFKAPLAGWTPRNSSRQGSSPASGSDMIWALKDVSLDIPQGEILGIIGKNGAGKTTLLKILSRITEPTTGRVQLWGRVGSLLEVGTGFHQELTGRENIFMNGAILGMSRREIQRKFHEIVAFAEIEPFLDTPLKRYSTGMGMRLAFAVAAHLETDILLVDEVLAVGDFSFQKKCIGKMGDVARLGRTVLFVSHNMHAIVNLC
ncbi:MAG: ABC transporter ATP-binding protein, partial [Desulfobaccales bacterium]